MGLRSKLSVSSKLVLPSANEKIWLRLERLVVVTSGRCASRVRTNRYRALDSVSVTSFRYLNEMACDSSLVRQQVARWAAECHIVINFISLANKTATANIAVVM